MDLTKDYPITTVCEVLNYPRSQVYYQPRPVEDETTIKGAMMAIAGKYPTYGYRRITVMLQQEGHDGMGR